MFDILHSSHRGDVMAEDLKNYVGPTVRMIGNFLTDKPVHNIKNQIVFFAAWLDNNGGWFDIVHFPQSFKYKPIQRPAELPNPWQSDPGVYIQKFGSDPL